MRALLPALSLLCCAAAPASRPDPGPHPGQVETFRDWAVGCDNAKSCTLASLAPEDSDGEGVTMNVTIAAGPARDVRIVLATIGDAPKAAALAIDGKSYAGLVHGADGAVATGPAAAAILAALPGSRTLAALDAARRPIPGISPSGIAAALRYVDAAQGRAGTAGAFVATGAKPAAAIPTAPALPLVTAAPTGGRVAMATPAQVAALARSAKCDDPGDAKPQTFALGQGRALVLVPCGSGAYNMLSAAFVVTAGKPRPAPLDAPTGFGEATLVPIPVNATYRDGVLTSYAKGRGLGDCGTLQRFAWDGASFRLFEQSEMGECRGNPNFITTWRARLVRR